MTVENVIRVSLAMVLVWQIWFLHVRGWAGWKQLRKGKQAKQRKQSREKKEPKPFEGLTRRPVCELCETEAEKQERKRKREPPPKIERERGRQREVDTSKHFCLEKECRYHGWLGRENIVSNEHLSGGLWRQLKCVVCGKHFQETIGTVFYGSSVPAEDIMRAIVALCEGVNPRKVARIFGVDKDTVLIWLVEAAIHSEAVIEYMVHNLQLTQVQMDELYALLSGMREEGGNGKAAACGRQWTRSASWVGRRSGGSESGHTCTCATSAGVAQRLVHGVVSVLAPGVVPMFLTDQLAAYGKALLTHFGHWVEKVSEKSGRTLRRWMSVERLRYTQVEKKWRRGLSMPKSICA